MRIRLIAKQNSKIGMVSFIRSVSFLGLKEAKDFVEQHFYQGVGNESDCYRQGSEVIVHVSVDMLVQSAIADTTRVFKHWDLFVIEELPGTPEVKLS